MDQLPAADPQRPLHLLVGGVDAAAPLFGGALQQTRKTFPLRELRRVDPCPARDGGHQIMEVYRLLTDAARLDPWTDDQQWNTGRMLVQVLLSHQSMTPHRQPVV